MLSALALFAAEKSPLLGLTREQLLDKLGEPKSQLAAGGREVILFTRERVVLRNGVVVEVDILPPDFGARRATPAPVPAAAPVTAANPAPATNAAPVSGDPTPNAGNPPPQAPATSSAAPAAAPVAASTTETPPPAPVAPPEPQLAIKSVRPPSAGATRPAPKSEPVSAPVAVTPVATATANSPATKTDSPPAVAGKAPAAPSTTKETPVTTTAEKLPEPTPASEPAVAAANTPTPSAEPGAADRPDGANAAAAVEPKNGKTKKTAPKRNSAEPDFPEPEEAIFTGRTYLFAAIIIGAGAGFLIWQRKQQQLELAASAVSRPPFSFAPAAAEGGATFPSDLLASLEWKRFEELVAAYYSKTGVVAVRTKTGPDSPVHIKISWKGESRPFALVQCIAHPVGLVDAPRIQELFGVLTTEDIRRGYVVTTGKFNVSARDFAEEKHITLLSGDLLLEKVNALPAPVRAELIQEFSVGDYATPSCPKCDAKMALSDQDPKVWQCKTHPDATVRAWK